MNERTLVVWWDGAVVGTLAQDRHGDLSYVYDGAWLADPKRRALSRSLPLRAEPCGRRACRPFFGGLLPEESQRTGVAGVLGVSPANEFALLDRLGGDVAGALSLLAEGRRRPPLPFRPIRNRSTTKRSQRSSISCRGGRCSSARRDCG